MKKTLIVLFAVLGLLSSCEKSEELPDAVAFNKIPDTDIAESKLGATVYTYDDLISITSGIYYERDAIYDCYKKGGKTYYIMKRRESRPDNANLLVDMDGISLSAIQIHDGYFAFNNGVDHEVWLTNYHFDEASQALNDIFWDSDFEGLPNILIYLSDDYLVLQTEKAWLKRSAEKGATFSRVVYKKCTELKFTIPTDTVDRRQRQ